MEQAHIRFEVGLCRVTLRLSNPFVFGDRVGLSLYVRRCASAARLLGDSPGGVIALKFMSVLNFQHKNAQILGQALTHPPRLIVILFN